MRPALEKFIKFIKFINFGIFAIFEPFIHMLNTVPRGRCHSEHTRNLLVAIVREPRDSSPPGSE